MPPLLPLRVLRVLRLLACLLPSLFGLGAAATETPLVAFMPATLLRSADRFGHELKFGETLAERVQLELAGDERWRLVERASLAAIERELSLSASLASSLQISRLHRADWLLNLFLDATDPGRPALRAEVFDAMRADRLAAQLVPLRDVPDESWLSHPSENAVRLARDAVAAALEAAQARRLALQGRTVVLPLAFLNLSGTDRLSPLAAAFADALSRHAESPDSGVRLLNVAASGDIHDESLLVLAGMTDASPEDWARVADVFLWAEWAEEGPSDAGDGSMKVSARTVLASGGKKDEIKALSGTTADLATLADRLAGETLAALRGAKGALSDSDRQAAAAHLFRAARVVGQPAGSLSSPRQREHFALAARWIDTASFLAPDDRSLGELRARMRLRASSGEAEEARWRSEYWRMVARLVVDKQGRLDAGLLERAATNHVGFPNASDSAGLLLSLVEQLRGRRFPPGVRPNAFSEFALGCIISNRESPRQMEVFETSWPLLYPHLTDPAQHNWYILWQIYGQDAERGRVFLSKTPPPADGTREVFVSPDPWRDFNRPLSREELATAPDREPPPPSRADKTPARAPRGTPGNLPPDFYIASPRAVVPGEVAPRANLDRLPKLELRWLGHERKTFRHGPFDWSHPLSDFALEPGSLWITQDMTHGGQTRSPDGYNGIRLDLRRQEPASAALSATALPEHARVSHILPSGARVFFATHESGVTVVDRLKQEQTRLGAREGLAYERVVRLAAGRDAVYVQHTPDPPPPDGPAPFGYDPAESVSRIVLPSLAVEPVLPEQSASLAGLPAAVRSAIASYAGSGDSPRVRLPRMLCESDWGERQPGDTRRPRPMEPRFRPAFCRTGADDGYWVSDGRAVAWAAGDTVREFMRWKHARVSALADDGRYLFVAATVPGVSSPGLPASRRDEWRVYVYDHSSGLWKGWLQVPAPVAGLAASPGLLALHARILHDGTSDIHFVSTKELHPSAPPGAAFGNPAAVPDIFSIVAGGSPDELRDALGHGADANAKSATGWTPLMAAAWSARGDGGIAMIRLLLEAGAKTGVADVRGWHPLQIAAAFAPEEAVALLLRHGASPNFQAAPQNASGPRPTALHAALLSGRLGAARQLLEAGADPEKTDHNGESAADLAARIDPTLLARPNGGAAAREAVVDSGADLVRLVRAQSGEALFAALQSIGPGADPLWRPEQGTDRSTALELVIRKQDDRAAAFLVSRLDAARLNAPDPLPSFRENRRSLGISHLRAALAAGRPGLADLLIRQGLRLSRADDGDQKELRPETYLVMQAVNHRAPALLRKLRESGFPVPVGNSCMNLVREKVIALRDPELLRALLVPVGDNYDRNFEGVALDLAGESTPTLLSEAIATEWWEGMEILLGAGAQKTVWNNRTQSGLSALVRPHPEIAVRFNDRPGSPDNTLEGAKALADYAVHGRELEERRLTPSVLRYREHDGGSLLVAAIRRADAALVRRILSAARATAAPPGVDDFIRPRGETPLLLAILHCPAETTAALLDAGARPDGVAGTITPLVFAVMQNHPAHVDLLLARGANPALPARATNDTTPVMAAAMLRDDLSMLQKIAALPGVSLDVRNDEGHGLLEAAVISDSPEKIRWLVGQGVTWRKPWPSKYHPLLTASRRGLTRSVRELLAMGLSHPSALSVARDDATRAVLQSAPGEDARAMRLNETLWPDILKGAPGWRERADALLADGGDVNHRSAKWGCPLLLALRREQLECLEYLVAKGADTSVRHGSHMMRPEGDTLLNVWLKRRLGIVDGLPRDNRERDELALRYIEIFWKHEADAEEKAELVEGAFERDLPLAAARLVALGAPPDGALRQLEKLHYSPEVDARWRSALGAAPAKTP